MLEILIDNMDTIFVIFGGRVFQETVDMHMGTRCAPLLADFFRYSYEVDFIQGLLKKNEKKLSLNNYRFGDSVDRNYPIEFEIQDTTDTDRSTLCLDIQLEVDSERRVRTKLYEKRDDFNFLSVDTIFQSLWFLSRFP
jgi:hypothetical protein